ncbi:hypothetical protein ESCO_002076 [Escovopsis weberi]|uniref:Uncharacterized protein n=1 Tax=Escovopsis weberi TaxID=150374 RepID=A0A0M9VWC0_ESCWE|nr:hypothetical protein ESCO_002076 [Escovopsis weberi]
MCQQVVFCKVCERCLRSLPAKIEVTWCEKRSNENHPRARVAGTTSPHACEDMVTITLRLDASLQAGYNTWCVSCNAGSADSLLVRSEGGGIYPHFGLVLVPVLRSEN